MKFLLPLYLFFTIALAATDFRLLVRHTGAEPAASEYLAIKGTDGVLSTTPQSTIVNAFLDPEPVGGLWNGTTPAYLLPTKTKNLYELKFDKIPATPSGVLYQHWTFSDASDQSYLTYNSSKEAAARYEGNFRIDVIDSVPKIMWALNFLVPMGTSSLIKLQRELVATT